MGWKEEKRLVLVCLEEGNYLHEQRGDIDVKNDLSTGDVTVEEVIELLKRARGTDHSMSPHHTVHGVSVNIVKARDWYVKWYYLSPNAVFISVHK